MHPGQTLLGVNSDGRILHLSSNPDESESSRWIELPYLGIDFKRLDVARNCIWAIGGDHQVYVMVFGVEVPIRVKETTYENERWNPVDGFCSHLLPTDRPGFSSQDGKQKRLKSTFKLPSLAWQWEADWTIDTSFQGKTLDKEGWTYAVDFPADYKPKKSFTSCVRRRKWVRTRKYVATDTWSAVPAIHKDVVEEPFIDISVGGDELPNGAPDELTVWAVTVLGRVLVRQGVTTNQCPEGTGWLHIPTPNGCEVSQVSVSSAGLVWAVTWNGRALVRMGVSRIDPTGTSWCEIDSPGPHSHLQHISVGEQSVWALSRDRRVWLRNGVRASAQTDSLAKGTKWIEMVGELRMISVGPNDQVFGITDDEAHSIAFRTGVTPSDLSGKTWKPLTVGPVRMRTYSAASSSTTSIAGEVSAASPSSLVSSTSSSITQGTSNVNFKPGARSPPVVVSQTDTKRKAVSRDRADSEPSVDTVGQSMYYSTLNEEAHMKLSEEDKEDVSLSEQRCESLPANAGQAGLDKQPLQRTDSLGKPPPAASGVSGDRVSLSSAASGPAVIDHEENYGFDDVYLSQYQQQQEGLGYGGPQWVWLSAGACQVSQATPPPHHWFIESQSAADTVSLGSVAGQSESSLVREPWRVDILKNLKDNNDTVLGDERYKNYETAVERSSWVRKATAKFRNGSHDGSNGSRWEQCTVELEQTGSPSPQGGSAAGIDFGTLSIFGTARKSKIILKPRKRFRVTRKEHLSLYEINCVCQSGEKALSIFTPERSLKLRPLQIRFSGDLEMEEWQADIVHGMNSVRGVSTSAPGPNCVLSLTSSGEVLAFDPRQPEECGFDPQVKQLDGQYVQTISLEGKDTPVVRSLENGLIPGTVVSFSLLCKEKCNEFSINLQTGRPTADDPLAIALHIKPRLTGRHTALNSKLTGAWGREERQPLMVFQDDGVTATEAFRPGQPVQVVIKVEQNYYQIIINGHPYARFNHRIKPEEVTHFRLSGDVEPKMAIYYSKSVIVPPSQMYWRCLGGGHFLKVESSPGGVAWALGYNSAPWVYTGGWGGAHYKGVASSKDGLNQLQDTKYFYIYENQRWNPLTGFTAHGLPTDRHCWSDKSGRLSMSKENVKVPSIHWQWVTDWLIDYTTPGGCDSEGWQYATDFPSTYHGKAGFTDYVRRRRWARKCRGQTQGPWKPLAHSASSTATKLVDISLQTRPDTDTVDLWAVSSSGEVLYRQGVRTHCPEGTGWLHVPGDAKFQSVSAGAGGRVWALGKDGRAFLRHGISNSNPTGQLWMQVAQPNTESPLRSISVGGTNLVWVVDAHNKLYLRQEVTVVFPEGTNWQFVASDVRAISASDLELFAILDITTNTNLVEDLVSAVLQGGQTQPEAGVKGVMARRSGMTPGNPVGSGWDIAIGGGWKHVSIRGKKKKF